MLTALEAQEIYSTLQLAFELAEENDDLPLMLKIGGSMQMLALLKSESIETYLNENPNA